MKTIDNEKKRLLPILVNRYCGIKDQSGCSLYSSGKACKCDKMAEIQALINIIIPDGFKKFTFDDFDGQDERGRNLLSPKTASSAKDKISKFCWGKDLSFIRALSVRDRVKYSVMGDRIKEGCNIVLSGESPREITKNNDGEVVRVREKPLGRTFIASILTKEAIGMRSFQGFNKMTYEWVEFSSLINCIKNDPELSTDYQTADWLVVDNIADYPLSASVASKSYLKLQLDPFFFHRMQQKRPTVLVFKFDIESKYPEIEDSFGIGISNIINNNNTLKISLKE